MAIVWNASLSVHWECLSNAVGNKTVSLFVIDNMETLLSHFYNNPT